MQHLVKALLSRTLISLGILGAGLNSNAQNTSPYPLGTLVNYVRTWDATAPENNENSLMGRLLSDVKQTTQYLDGLGRPLQTVIKQGSLETATGINVDMVSPVVYDQLGRETYKYLPFNANSTDGNTSISDGKFKLNPFQQQQNSIAQQYGNQGESYFYSKTNFEASPLGRVEKNMAAGNSWVGSNRGVEMKYWINTTVDAVRIWNVANISGSFGTYNTQASYPAGQLYKNATVDEHGKQVIEFKDKEGKVILKKVQFTAAADDGTGSSPDGWLSTFYIYDDLNLLRCVIQPEGVKQLPANNYQLTTTLLDEQCFRYEYDQRNRMIKKKVPGAGEVWMVYDARDRLVMTQDANMRTQKQWLYTSYDQLNRPIATGLITDPANYNNHSYHLNAAYNSAAYPVVANYANEELTNTYYDNYDWLATYNYPLSPTYDNRHDSYLQAASNTNPYPQANVQNWQVKGMVTGTRVKVLQTSIYLYNANLYDAKGRLIQVSTKNITGGFDITTTQYSWAGQPLTTVHSQDRWRSNDLQTFVEVSKMQYDDLGRLINIKKAVSANIGGATVSKPEQVIVQNEYDASGQLKTKKLGKKPGSTDPLETLTYEYNIRGWLLGMNRDYLRDKGSAGVKESYFGFELGYDKYTAIGASGFYFTQYNGNITGTVWKSKGDEVRRKYDFQYDNANRFGQGFYTQNSTTTTGGNWNKTEANFSVHGFDADNNWMMKYDANGNILSMIQKGYKIGNPTGEIDALYYEYNTGSNKLKRIVDDFNDYNSTLGDFKYDPASKGSVDYGYDANGNLQWDKNKKIDRIGYNYLNLVEGVTIRDKSDTVNTIVYKYDAAGNKLQKEVYSGAVPPGKTTLYLQGAVYEEGVLQFINHEEGRIRFKPAVGNNIPASFQYDYFIKDHLGNVRMVLTEEEQQDKYPTATLETAKLATEKNYYDIQDANIVDKSTATGITNYINDNGIGNNPSDPTFEQTNSAKLYKLNSNTAKTGLGITLKVMAGDKIDVFGKTYYFQNTNGTSGNNNLPIIDLLTAFLSAPAAAATTAAHGAVTAAQLNTPTGIAGINSMITQQNNQNNAAPNKPRAFINVIFFDEQFKSYDFKISMVGNNSVVKDHFSELQNLMANKSGYVYIYCSNESPVNVFFDNVQVVHTRSPLLEENTFYPFGLRAEGICSKAAGSLLNRYQYNGKELQNKEFSDGSGLELNDFGFRMQDPQIGRWHSVDPMADKYFGYSPYNYCVNNPINILDPFGLDVEEIAGGWRFTGDDAKSAFALLTNKKKNAFIDVRGGKENREKANYNKDPDYYKKWAVFSVGSLNDGIGMLSSFANNSLDNVAINTHGSSSESMFENKPKGENDSDDQVTSTEITNYNSDKSKNNTVTNDLISNVAKIGDKVSKGGNIIFIACFAGQGQEGQAMLRGLNTIFNNKANVFLPTDYSRIETYKTSKVLALDNMHLSANRNTRWITGNGTKSYSDIIINRADHLPAVQLIK